MSTSIRILFLDDSEDDARLVRHEIDRSGIRAVVDWVATAERFQDKLRKHAYDIILSDFNLPGFSAAGALKLARAAGQDAPFIVVSGAIGEQAAVDLMRQGAADFVSKGSLSRLVPVIQRELRELETRRGRRLAEHTLKQTQKRLTRLVNSNIVAILMADLCNGRIVDANNAFQTMVGYSLAELRTGDFTWQKLSPPEWATADKKALESLRLTGTVAPYEKEYYHRDGTRIPVLVAAALVEEDNIAIAYVLDITDRKQSEETQRLLADVTHLFSHRIDLNETLSQLGDLIVPRFSDGFAAYLVTTDGSIQCAFSHHHLPEMATQLQQTLRALAFQLGDATLVGTVIQNKTRLVWSRSELGNTVKPVLRELWEKTRIHSIMTTPLFLGERALGAIQFLRGGSHREFSMADLEVGSEMTHRLALAVENAELFRKAHEASRTKSLFLANVSHEIRTPLGAITGFAELALSSQDPGEVKNSLEVIYRNSQQLARLINDLLDISKIEAGQVHVERMPCSLKLILDDVLGSFEHRLREKDLTLKIYFENEIPDPIHTDPTRLRQILVNIIGNAIKFTDNGSVQIRIAADPFNTERRTSSITVKVEDTGVGITPDQAQRLFQPFVQAEHSVSRRFGGTGLGLFVSRKLARALGGDLLLERSVPGFGSTFSIRVEIQLPGKGQDECNPATLPPTRQKSDARLKGLRILVVDDSKDNQILLRRFLEGARAEVDIADNGLEALKMARLQRYDIILMDMQMPVMDGMEATRSLKDEGNPAPIVALTAHAMLEERQRSLQLGCAEHLTKPVDRQLLIETLARISQKAPIGS